MTEKLIEFIPEKKTVWTIESDSMGMGQMLKKHPVCFNLEELEDNKTKVISETYYQPANIIAKIMNGLIMKKWSLRRRNKFSWI